MWQVEGLVEVRELGVGAQGRVVLARHAASGQVFAVKYVPAVGAEAAALRAVQSPYVARLYDVVTGPPDGGAALVMEAVPGVSLRELLAARGALPAETALVLLKGSLLGLGAAHAAGVVHRDYKPGNVLVPPTGPSKLIDFGIAMAAGAAGRSGTPAYMAPEQWRDEPAGPPADVYAATCVFFECVTGAVPYQGDSAPTLGVQHTNAPIPAERVPEPLRPLLLAGLAKEPADRPASAGAFVAELESAAVAGYGADWEARGRRGLTELAAALAAASPVVAAILSGGAGAGAGAAAGGTAAATTFASTVLAKAGAIVAGVALAAGGTAVAVHHFAASGAVKPKPTATVSAAPVLEVASVAGPCAGTGPQGEKLASGQVPAKVRLPAQVKLPTGAAVYALSSGGGNADPAYYLGPAHSSCGYSQGTDGGTFLSIGKGRDKVSATLVVGGVGFMRTIACNYFADQDSRIAKSSPNTLEPCKTDLSQLPNRSVLQTGDRDLRAELIFDEGTSGQRGVSLLLATLGGDVPDPQSIGCAGTAALCSAVLTYFLVQAGPKLPQPTLDSLAATVRSYVAAHSS